MVKGAAENFAYLRYDLRNTIQGARLSKEEVISCPYEGDAELIIKGMWEHAELVSQASKGKVDPEAPRRFLEEHFQFTIRHYTISALPTEFDEKEGLKCLVTEEFSDRTICVAPREVVCIGAVKGHFVFKGVESGPGGSRYYHFVFWPGDGCHLKETGRGTGN